MRPFHVPLALLCLASTASSQTLNRHPEPAAHPTELPITRVALYKNGVGFFEHTGRVSGDQAVTIDFTSAQLNDVLQSLTAIDLGGGRISGAGYNSTTPLEQQLKTLPLALTDDPSDFDFYNAIRGARVAVSGPGLSLTGRLLAIDLRSTAKPKDADSTETDDKNGRRFLTVVSDAGAVKTFELTSAVTVTLLESALHTDVTRYLELLASTRSQGLRHLTLTDRGTGARELHVSYISEVPVWKSTYRILFTAGTSTTATLQGWSVVDNTTGSDWINVHMDLIAGAPQSFVQPLSTPYYARRPEVPIPEEAQLEPQTFASGDTELQSVQPGVVSDRFTGGRVQSLGKPQSFLAQKSRGLAGMAAGSGNGVARVYLGSGSPAMPAPAPPVSYEEAATDSITPQTTTAAFDDFFEYTLTDPITIRKNESALVPILQTKLPIERVTLWSARQPQALRALWVTNSSTLTLDRGSFSIVENGSFGGEGLLDPIHPGERRLLSYAADQAVTVDQRTPEARHKLRSLTISKGILTEHFRDVAEHTYTIRNAAADPRTVLLEHPRTSGYELTSETTQKPEETTAAVYRFRVSPAAHGSATIKVVESRTYATRIQADNINDQTVAAYLQELGPGNGDALRAQLQPVLDAQRKVADLDRRKSEIDNQLNNLRAEEERQRANITALKDADKLSQKRFVDKLGRIEDQILDLQKQHTAIEQQEQAAQADLANKVSQVQFEQTLDK